MSILNSVSRGFGLTIGNKMANSVINNFNQPNGEYKQSPSLSGKQIFKTIMWSFVMFGLSAFIVSIVYQTHLIGIKGGVVLGILLTMFFTYVIGKEYYNSNVITIKSVNDYNTLQKHKEELIQQTEDSYVSEKITKREYEVLMKRINKM